MAKPIPHNCVPSERSCVGNCAWYMDATSLSLHFHHQTLHLSTFTDTRGLRCKPCSSPDATSLPLHFHHQTLHLFTFTDTRGLRGKPCSSPDATSLPLHFHISSVIANGPSLLLSFMASCMCAAVMTGELSMSAIVRDSLRQLDTARCEKLLLRAALSKRRWASGAGRQNS